MSKKTDRAIAKITDEMMKLEDSIAQGVEEHLTDICTNDIIAGKILSKEKTVEGACEALWEAARKRKKGNSAYIAPEEAFAIIEEYFGINEDDKEPPVTECETVDLMSIF